MKKGCALTLLGVVTLVIGTIFYIYTHYGEEIEYRVKKEFVKIALNEMLDNAANENRGIYLDSIRTDLTNFVNELEFDNFKIDFEQTELLLQDAAKVLNDNSRKVEDKYIQIKEIVAAYEKSKKDRN
jgi:hypothetical protein